MDFTEKLKVMYGTYPKEADMTEELVDLPSIQTTTVLTEEVPFTVEEDGVYYFGFNVYSNPYNANLNIDDIIIEQDEEDIFYCESEYYSSCEFGNQISNVSLQGESVNLDNDSQCSNGGNGDYTQLDNPDLLPGGTYEVSVSSDYFFLLGQNIRIWIDYDNDGVFDDSEEIGNTNGSGMHNSGTNSFTFTIPADIQEGLHRMRVRLVSHDGYIDPCGEEFSGETEDYNVSILPAPSCLPPSNLEISSIENSSAQLSWTPHSDETQWDVVYGVSGFVQNNGDSETLTVNTQPEVTIDGLNPGTMYDVYVKTICSENDESSASPILSFITQCEAANLPFFQDFEDVDIPNIPLCGSIETISGNDWITAFDEHSDSYNQQLVYSSDFMSDANAWYFTREIELEAGITYQISYDYGNVNSSFIEKLKVSMGESNSADDMTVELADHPNIYLGGKVNNVVYFSVENDGTYYFGFNAYSSPMGLNLFLDNISIDFAPDCIPVSGLNYSEISTSSVKLDWIENGNSTQWEIVYGESGFDVEGSDSQSIFANDYPEFILSDLESNTTYDIYIRSVCDEDGSSAFSEPVTITTFCDAASVPFIQDFEDVTTPNIPACSTVEVIDGGNWRSNTATGIGFSGKVLQYQSDYGNDPANSWFFLQGIELEAGINYTISFGYANGTMDFTEKLKVMYGTYPKEADMTEELVDLPSIQTTTVLTEEVPFTVEEDGVYYFGFNVYSNPYNANLNIDDIIIEQDEEDIFYCESEYYSSCEFGNQISNVSLQGESVNLDNDSQCSNGGNGDYTQLDNPDLLPGGTYEVSVSSDYFFLLGQNIRIWIDYDNDGVFDDSEEIGNTNGSGMHNSGTNSFTFTIPADIQEGLHRMRVRLVSHDGYIDPCGEEFSGETEDYNVSILPAPSCLPPSNLEISSIENSSAQLSWTPHSDETQWDVVYGVSGFVQNNGDSETLTVNTQPEVTIDGLNPGTMYDVYVKTICSENDESSASPILSFITQCEAANLPFFQDFEDVDIPNVPVCGSIETIIGNDWITAFDYHTASYNQQIVYSSDFISDAIAWYFIVEIALEADNPYQV